MFANANTLLTAQGQGFVSLDVRREHTPALLELVDHLGLELDADV